MNANQVSSAKTSELVAFYNHHSDKPVSKFQDRATAERRVLALIESLPSDADYARHPDLARMIAPNPLAVRPEAERAATKAKLFSSNAAPKPAATRADRDLCCPACGETQDQTYAGEEGTAAGERMFCHHCSTEYYPNGKVYRRPATGASRSEAIAATWKRPEVAASRTKRVAVAVRGAGEFKSVPEAFRALRLPVSKVIPFRLEVQKTGEAVFEFGGKRYTFQVLSVE